MIRPAPARFTGRVHVVGNACLDLTFRVARFPAAGETLNAEGMAEGLGGKGANQAAAAARTGATVAFRAAVGTDGEARRIAELLAAHGLRDVRLAALPGPSDRSVIFLDAQGENRIVSAVPAARAFDPLADGGLAATAGAGDVMVLQNNLRPEPTAACLDIARAREMFAVFNASPLVPGTASPPFALAGLVVANAGEAAALTGEVVPERAAQALVAAGAGAAVVTLGAAGALLAMAGEAPRLIPAPRVEAVDTSGAGDVFCGVLAGMLATGLPLELSVQAAARAAAIAVTRAGTAASCPSGEEIAAIRAEVERMTG